MNANGQAKNRGRMNKVKRAKPAASLTGEPTPSCESYHQVNMLITNQDIPEFDTGVLAGTLLLALERAGRTLPDPAYMSILRVAACLKKHQSDEVISDIQVREVIRKARAGK